MDANITRVPPEVAVAIASWLDSPQDLTALALASKSMVNSPFCSVCFHQKIRIHVRSGSQFSALLADSQGLPLLQALQATLSITLMDEFPQLHKRVLERVETLAVTVAYHSVVKETLEVLSGLSLFSNLTALELSGAYEHFLTLSWLKGGK